MSELEETAMAFCREVLGWKKPEFSGNTRTELMWENAPGGTRFLPFTDLNGVIRAVRAWSDKMKIESCDLPPRWYAEVWLNAEEQGKGWLRGQARNNDLCHALMAACVEASRKKKERP